MRVYVPCTLPALAAAHAAGSIAPAPVTAFAVTPTLREWYTAGDIEELEFTAMLDAARASLRLLLSEPLAPRRRVVIAVDVPDTLVAPQPHLDRSALHVTSPITLASWASVHVDAAEAVEDVRKAVEAVELADRGDIDAGFTVDAADDHALLWYATQEVPYLVG